MGTAFPLHIKCEYLRILTLKAFSCHFHHFTIVYPRDFPVPPSVTFNVQQVTFVSERFWFQVMIW